MADIKTCNDTCGCPIPCPGDVSCRCTNMAGSGAVQGEQGTHSVCPCGKHCQCNPCSCGRTEVRATAGSARCTCGPNCTCSSCAAA